MSNKFLDKITKNFYNTYPDLTETSRKVIMRNLIMLHKGITGNDEIKSLNFVYKKDAILKYSLSATRSKKEAARFLGINLENFKKLIKKYDTESYFKELDNN